MSNSNDDRSLSERLLAELAAAPDGVSLPRLCKRLRVRMSVLLREIAWLGDEPIGGSTGAGLIRVEDRGELRIAGLTERDHAVASTPSTSSAGSE
jgi:hypothetical protein